MCDVFKVEGTKDDGRLFVELPNGDEVNLFMWKVEGDSEAIVQYPLTMYALTVRGTPEQIGLVG